MPDAHLNDGQRAEDQACRYLRRQGLTLIQRNYRCRLGELDMVMQHGQELVFVEVRYRQHSGYGRPEESITPAKQRKLWRAASVYLLENPKKAKMPARFDVIAITEHPEHGEVKWIRNAFQLS